MRRAGAERVVSPVPTEAPEWMKRELMERYAKFERGELRPPPLVLTTNEERLASLGYDGSRLRRRYWKKVRFADEARPVTVACDHVECDVERCKYREPATGGAA